MFQKVRLQLLLSYQVVLAGILIVFAVSIRSTFTFSLHQQQTQRLQNLVKAATHELDIENGRYEIDQEDLVGNDQSLQWYTPQGKLLGVQGQPLSKLPFSLQEEAQVQTQSDLQSLTMAITDPRTGQVIGYVRGNESLKSLNQTLSKLDWGLGGGAILALILSGISSIWLTRKAMHPVEQSMRKLQQFTADASHELRSPLTAIKTNAMVALKYPKGMRATDAEKFSAIASATTQMTTLTESLLLLARLDQSPVHQQDHLNLTPTLEQLIRSFRLQSEAQHISLTTQLPEELMVVGNEDQLRRLFTNLIDNALRYTNPGGKVRIDSQFVGQSLHIKVHDTGIGLTPNQIEHIFDRFWQAESSRSYQVEGCGLGLAIAQSIAKHHGGIITVTSGWAQGKGSCFTVQLPSLL